MTNDDMKIVRINEGDDHLFDEVTRELLEKVSAVVTDIRKAVDRAREVH